ncbi:MAG: DUF4920 domain-containing protein [Planctomycetes bacterium]|nr:DUF4920 domain-containing protein [Planctomycetota bacterium]
MKPRLLALALLSLTAACATTPKAPALPVGTHIGEEMTPGPITRFAVIDATPAEFIGKTLLVEADVKAVCAKAGCWMQVEDDGATSLVRWESGCGGAYKFPMESVGHHVVIQGTFYSKELTPEQRAHMEEEAGKPLELRPDAYEFNASAVLVLEDE